MLKLESVCIKKNIPSSRVLFCNGYSPSQLIAWSLHTDACTKVKLNRALSWLSGVCSVNKCHAVSWGDHELLKNVAAMSHGASSGADSCCICLLWISYISPGLIHFSLKGAGEGVFICKEICCSCNFIPFALVFFVIQHVQGSPIFSNPVQKFV